MLSGVILWVLTGLPRLSSWKASVLKAMCGPSSFSSHDRPLWVCHSWPLTHLLPCILWFLSPLSSFFSNIMLSWWFTVALFLNIIYFHYFFSTCFLFFKFPYSLFSIWVEHIHFQDLFLTCSFFLSQLVQLCSNFNSHKSHWRMGTGPRY